VIAAGTPPTLIRSLGAEHVVRFSAGDGLEGPALGTLPGVTEVRREAADWALIVREPHTAIPALLEHLRARGAALSQLTTHQATLEDVFVHLTGRTLRDD
jgi:ABC-2 type transport system ATP-binding protein